MATLLAIGLLALAGACGAASTSSAPGAGGAAEAQAPRVIQDPDNPAARNFVPQTTTTEAGPRVIQDPDNTAARNYAPQGLTSLGTAPLDPTAASRPVRDPDNPYWNGR